MRKKFNFILFTLFQNFLGLNKRQISFNFNFLKMPTLKYFQFENIIQRSKNVAYLNFLIQLVLK